MNQPTLLHRHPDRLSPQACHDYFGRLPFQACRVHLTRRAADILSTPPGRTHAKTNNELKLLVHRILFTSTQDKADDAYYQLTTREHRFTSRAARTILTQWRRTYDLYTTHHRYPGLPADANTTENGVRSLNRKIGPMEHFATIQSADHYSRLLIANYRGNDSPTPTTDTTATHPSNSPASPSPPHTGSITSNRHTQRDAAQNSDSEEISDLGQPGRDRACCSGESRDEPAVQVDHITTFEVTLLVPLIGGVEQGTVTEVDPHRVERHGDERRPRTVHAGDDDHRSRLSTSSFDSVDGRLR